MLVLQNQKLQAKSHTPHTHTKLRKAVVHDTLLCATMYFDSVVVAVVIVAVGACFCVIAAADAADAVVICLKECFCVCAHGMTHRL